MADTRLIEDTGDNQTLGHLEQAIDDYSLRAVLDALHGICYAKAEHIRTEWQDAQTARAWEHAARYLESAIRHASDLGV